MKKYEFSINKSYLEVFFPHKRVKTKVDVLIILMETIKYMKLNPVVTNEDCVGKIVLYIDKMSRLFFFTENKYYSIVFPFFVDRKKIEDEYENEDELPLSTTYTVKEYEYLFSFRNQIDIDESLVSQVISLIKCDEFKDNCSLEFITPICQYNEQYDKNFWPFLRELLFMEDGYIRYDLDKENFDKAKEKDEEHKHPLNHYDVFYSSNTTYKIGLIRNLAENEFIDFLDGNKDCSYLN